MELLDETTIKFTYTSSAWGTEPNSAQQVWYVGIQEEMFKKF